MIDTGRLDASKPIDLSAIVNTKVFPIEPSFQHFGVNLTDEVVNPTLLTRLYFCITVRNPDQ